MRGERSGQNHKLGICHFTFGFCADYPLLTAEIRQINRGMPPATSVILLDAAKTITNRQSELVALASKISPRD